MWVREDGMPDGQEGAQGQHGSLRSAGGQACDQDEQENTTQRERASPREASKQGLWASGIYVGVCVPPCCDWVWIY